MKNAWLYTALIICCFLESKSQGCISVRNLVGFGQFALPQYDEEPPNWLINVNSRSLAFRKIYWGTERQDVPPENEQPTSIFVVDFAVTRLLPNGWSISLDVPITTGSRSSWQEHGFDANNKVKYTTHSFGLSDVRVTVYKWLLNTSEYHKGNIQAGMGLKLPTGDYRFQDFFNRASGKELKPVNTAIQLGDGGTGISIEANAFYILSASFALYANAFYLFNPRDQNGTVPVFPQTFTPDQVEATLNTTSVPDSYTTRAGINFNKNGLTLGLGVRWEGTPVHDAIGSSNGLRRAGAIGSVEPGFNYRLKKTTLYAFVPLAFYKRTDKIVPDQRLDELEPGTTHTSPGGFSDYLLFLGVLFQL